MEPTLRPSMTPGEGSQQDHKTNILAGTTAAMAVSTTSTLLQTMTPGEGSQQDHKTNILAGTTAAMAVLSKLSTCNTWFIYHHPSQTLQYLCRKY